MTIFLWLYQFLRMYACIGILHTSRNSLPSNEIFSWCVEAPPCRNFCFVPALYVFLPQAKLTLAFSLAAVTILKDPLDLRNAKLAWTRARKTRDDGRPKFQTDYGRCFQCTRPTTCPPLPKVTESDIMAEDAQWGWRGAHIMPANRRHCRLLLPCKVGFSGKMGWRHMMSDVESTHFPIQNENTCFSWTKPNYW